MIELEYHHCATPSDLTGPGTEHQQLLISPTDNTDTICLSLKEHNTTYSLAKGIKPESDQASGLLLKCSKKKKKREEQVELYYKYAICKIQDCGKHYRSNSLEFSSRNCKKGMVSDLED